MIIISVDTFFFAFKIESMWCDARRHILSVKSSLEISVA